MLINRQPSVTLIGCCPVATDVSSDRDEDRQTKRQTQWSGPTRGEGQVTLIISLRCDSGSRPAMGRIRIFCVLEQRSARDSVIFLWVALSVEWGLQIQKTTRVRFRATVHMFWKSLSVLLLKWQRNSGLFDYGRIKYDKKLRGPD